MHEPGLSNDRPLAEARLRLHRAERAKRPKVKNKTSRLTEHQVGMAMGMRIAGIPTPKIAQGLKVPPYIVHQQIEAIPDYQETIQRLRRELKLTKMQKAMHIEERLWGLADKKITDDDPKGVDATLRALHASEKIQAAVAGEGQKVEVTTNQASPSEIQSLIQVILQR